MASVITIKTVYNINITNLDLSANNFIKLPPKLQYLTKLTHLDVSYNKLTKLSTHIQYLTRLTILDLSYNKLRALPTDIQYLNNAQQQLFLLKNDIEKSTDDYDNNINQIDKQLKTLDKGNNKLSKKLASLIERNYGGKGMLVDTNVLYTQKKYANYLFAGIIVCIGGYYYKMHMQMK